MDKIVNNGEIDISEELWIELNKNHDKEFIKKLISDAIGDNKLELPYRKITLEEAKTDFIKLCNFDIRELLVKEEFLSRYDYKFAFRKEYLELCNAGNKSSDYFQQENRFKCDSINAPSPFRTWNSEKFRLTLLNCLWTLKFKKINNDTLRSAISLRKYIASQFKPSIAKYVYETYKAKNVLDFSSGWGDRLAGFHASKDTKRYVGIDPNVDVVNKYNDQIDFYKKCGIKDKEVKIYNLPAEEVVLENNDKFDLIFTSPPYFDIERYTTEKNQSWKKYKKIDNWLNDFLFKSIGYFWNHLEKDGHMIINISNVYCHHMIQNICDPMNEFISKLEGAEYEGALGMRMAKRPNSKALKEGVFAEPMWIWRKK